MKLSDFIQIITNNYKLENSKDVQQKLCEAFEDVSGDNAVIGVEHFEKILKLLRKEYEYCKDHCAHIERLMKLNISPTFEK